MINGLGIVGWGVGGIEAEAAMLGQPVLYPGHQKCSVSHFKGELQEGVTATDLVLTVTQTSSELLQSSANLSSSLATVVEALSLPDRATISNMCPEIRSHYRILPA